MRTFAYAVSPATIQQLKNSWPAIRIIPDFVVRTSLKKISPFKVAQIKPLRSSQGRQIQGYIILCPLLTQETQILEEDFILDKIRAAAAVAERLGAQILGLDGGVSTLVEKRSLALQNSGIPLTSGSAFTAWSVIEAIYRISKAKDVSLKNAALVVIGASGSVGSLCARKLSHFVSKISVFDDEKDKLERLKESILHLNSILVIVEDDYQKIAREADIIIYAANSPGTSLNIDELKSGALVCDISLNKDILSKAGLRKDITIIEGGLIRPPYPLELSINMGLPKGTIPASLAETMLLAFEGKLVNYSLGDNINLDKLEEIADIAVRHGFEVYVPGAPLV
jgi:predicted amino acid dehydrogenase